MGGMSSCWRQLRQADRKKEKNKQNRQIKTISLQTLMRYCRVVGGRSRSPYVYIISYIRIGLVQTGICSRWHGHRCVPVRIRTRHVEAISVRTPTARPLSVWRIRYPYRAILSGGCTNRIVHMSTSRQQLLAVQTTDPIYLHVQLIYLHCMGQACPNTVQYQILASPIVANYQLIVQYTFHAQEGLPRDRQVITHPCR